jgi:Na+/H+ antiporter NhaD/arsenite permease-like protein
MTELSSSWLGVAALFIFSAAYAGALLEERLHLRKSIPMLVAAGLIWLLASVAYAQHGTTDTAVEALRHNLLEFAEIFLFLVVAMTYVNTIGERGVFDALRTWLVGRGLSLRALFWVTGGLAFLLSPVADNLTTALVLGAVAMAVGQGRPKFVTLACINIVVAANAGGVFSPFGDITTLMVWQAEHISFAGFFPLVGPALANWLVPALCLSLAVERGDPVVVRETAAAQAGAGNVVALFLVTIVLTVLLYNALHLPPAVGMMFGLGLLQLYGYLFNRRAHGRMLTIDELDDVFARPALMADAQAGHDAAAVAHGGGQPARAKPLHTFRLLERIEWDTLLFFYGVILGVGGLGALGYLVLISQSFYTGLGPTAANVLVGLLSAIIDNVPVMFAVLAMDPPMSQGQWLLVTLTAGVGGSLLSIGSAAGVALMGQARGSYTFLAHLRWSWAVALGYAASIAVHLLLNRPLF